MDNTTQKEEVTDYEREWELDTDASSSSSVGSQDNQQTEESDHLSEDSAPVVNADATPEEDQTNSAVSEEVDLWAGASDAQRDAFRRAENEKIAAENRAKLNADKLAERGRELKSLRDETSELREAARPRTEFEQEHSTYANDINTMIEQRLAERLPVQEEQTEQERDQEVYETITQAHPDAGELYNSDSLKELLNEDPVFKMDGRAVLFSEALHSSDPRHVNQALDFYKLNHTAPPPEADPLESMQANTSRGAQRDMRTADQLSQSERYDAEWELDDDI